MFKTIEPTEINFEWSGSNKNEFNRIYLESSEASAARKYAQNSPVRTSIAKTAKGI